ncbi:MAG: archease [Candidatus Portnoybacteria bacterium]|nr:archease [Candidatus Portnoybacteria bacterium]
MEAEFVGYPVDYFDGDIKAATYHEVEIKRGNKKWEAAALFDI